MKLLKTLAPAEIPGKADRLLIAGFLQCKAGTHRGVLKRADSL